MKMTTSPLALTTLALAGLFAAYPASANPTSPTSTPTATVYTDRSKFTPAAKEVCPDIDNLLVNPTVGANGPSNTVYGATQEGFGITFTSPSLLIASGGQADIDGANNTSFTQITLTPTNPNSCLDVLEFNVNGVNSARGTDITMNLLGGGSVTQKLDPGLTFFGIIAAPGASIKSVSLNAPGGISDIRQVRVCDDCQNSPGVPAAVPEPGSVAAMSLGGVGLLGLVFRKTRRSA